MASLLRGQAVCRLADRANRSTSKLVLRGEQANGPRKEHRPMESVRNWSRHTTRSQEGLGRRWQRPSKTLDSIDGFLDNKRSLTGVQPHRLTQAVAKPGDRRHPCNDTSMRAGGDQGGRTKVKELATVIEDESSYDKAFRVQKLLAKTLITQSSKGGCQNTRTR